MDVVDLRPDLRMLVGTPGQAYLHRRGDEVLLVDTGPVGSGPVIAAALRDWGLGPEAVSDVVLTHWHADHAGSAAEVATWPNARILVHAADAPVVRGERPGPPPVLTPAEEVLHRQVAGNLPDAPPARVDHELADGEVLASGARVLATPGHTAGSLALVLDDAGVVLTGDLAAEHEGGVILGPFNVDRELARRSFRRFGEVDVELACFGHGRPVAGSVLRAAALAAEVPDPLG
ncbi:MBL fold metallo-hydrolase [Pseudonocardia halophobica]|uniref:MBL fold metallo-hydrolase n=1 Tax=Pseudonocardia halophobica TaxID=29401 RepID=A0A9W6P0B1_9PSEU|nr:MBL fold metallo-hydrolase [Pseudonocardia halophobica]GLL15436.1 MBL fold metallo-hydrolase [Pseudonocardia halophobica]